MTYIESSYMAKLTKQQIADKNEALENLRALFAETRAPENAHLTERELAAMRTVYVVLRSVSKSGMSRTMTLFVMRNGEPHYITYDVARAVGWNRDREGNLKVSGCGMDMGFHVVYTLAGLLYPGERGGNTLTHRWV